MTPPDTRSVWQTHSAKASQSSQSFAMKWNETADYDGCKLLKTWWPGTGIEPPTPAFSGLDSARAILLITKEKRSLFVPKSAHLLGQEWDKILADQNCLSHACPALVLCKPHKLFPDPFEQGRKEVAKGREASVQRGRRQKAPGAFARIPWRQRVRQAFPLFHGPGDNQIIELGQLRRRTGSRLDRRRRRSLARRPRDWRPSRCPHHRRRWQCPRRVRLRTIGIERQNVSSEFPIRSALQRNPGSLLLGLAAWHRLASSLSQSPFHFRLRLLGRPRLMPNWGHRAVGTIACGALIASPIFPPHS